MKEKEQEQIALLSQDKVALDLQHETLQQSYQSARTELGRKREEIERSAYNMSTKYLYLGGGRDRFYTVFVLQVQT